MRVLHVEAGRHLYGGARQVLYLLEGLQQRGVENCLACPPDAALAEPARQFVTDVIPMPMGDASLALPGRLMATIRRHRPDLVHLHSRRGADLWGGLAARRTGVPVVLSRRVDNPEFRPWVALKYRLYDRVITISEAIRQLLIEEGVAPWRVVCVRSAVKAAAPQMPGDPRPFTTAFGIPEDALVVGMVAQLIERKGHRLLLAALPTLLTRFPRLRVVCFGQGPLRKTLERETTRQGLASVVHWAGFRPDLATFLPALDLLVHPAWREGLGIALLQAAAAGVPIIASRAGGMPEAVREGENGLLIPAGDVAALGAAMGALLADQALRRRLGNRGRQIIEREFSVDRMVEGNLAVYRALLASNP
ncbi:Glycosyltransferase family protein [Gammaproteobacteria bacterium]